MRLLIDENLPVAIRDCLPADSVHATEFGRRLTDREIWDLAISDDRIILTRDTDFFDRLALEGPPPKVIWVRLGNIRRKALMDWLASKWPSIESLIMDCDLLSLHDDAMETFKFHKIDP